MAKEKLKPTFDVLIPSTEDRNARPDDVRWTKIGAAWPAKQVEGWNIQLNSHPIGRSIILRVPKTKEEWDAEKENQE